MGVALWLYLYVLSRAQVAQRDGRLAYSHVDAAQALGVSERTVKRWYRTLQEHGYVHTRARQPYGLGVEVANWRPVAEWLETRSCRTAFTGKRGDSVQERGDDVADRGDIPVVGGDRRGDASSDSSVVPHITIRLGSYRYPSGSAEAERANLSEAYEGLLQALRRSRNQPALLRRIYGLCFGSQALPDYGYLGRVANKVGGAGRLAQLMWQLSANRPSGDPLAYILALHGNKGKRVKGGSRKPLDEADRAIRAFAGRGKDGQ